MLICSCCNPPLVKGILTNAIKVSRDFPTEEWRDGIRVSKEGLKKLEEKGFFYRPNNGSDSGCWCSPQGEIILGILDF